jgi:hypothetical protein
LHRPTRCSEPGIAPLRTCRERPHGRRAVDQRSVLWNAVRLTCWRRNAKQRAGAIGPVQTRSPLRAARLGVGEPDLEPVRDVSRVRTCSCARTCSTQARRRARLRSFPEQSPAERHVLACETRTSTCRNLATISSGLYHFLAIAVLLDVRDIPQVGPLQWGGSRPPWSGAHHGQGRLSRSSTLGLNSTLFARFPEIIAALLRPFSLTVDYRLADAAGEIVHGPIFAPIVPGRGSYKAA